MKPKVQYVCRACGHRTPKWLGQCPECQAWNTLEEDHAPAAARASRRGTGAHPPLRSLGEIDGEDLTRYRSGMDELDRVLGGGLVPGSLVLVAGDPGIGKSTLLLEAASAYAARGLRVLYVSAEDSERQLRLRSRRLGDVHDAIRVLASTRMESVLPAIEDAEVDVVVVDSIQTLYSAESGSSPGSPAQVRDNALAFLELAKRTHVPILLVGHVTKEGTVAGPRVMEHMVDAVVYLEGDPFHPYRVLRAAKNRFGPTHEAGMFEMGDRGLREVKNPSEFLLGERREGTSGSAVVVAMEGTRPVLLEVQALVGSAGYGSPRRVATGPDPRRIAVLLAVLERRAGLDLSTSDVFVNVAGGFRIAEPAADLGIALAVASSYYDVPVDPRTVALGEVGLAGEVRRVSRLPIRLREAAKLGFTAAVVPERSLPLGEEVGLVASGASRIDEALSRVLGAGLGGARPRPVAGSRAPDDRPGVPTGRGGRRG
jgi:DNA repair protein RadA/Sms